MAGSVILLAALLIFGGVQLRASEVAHADPVIMGGLAGAELGELRVTVAGFPEVVSGVGEPRQRVAAVAELSRGQIPVTLWVESGHELTPGAAFVVRGTLREQPAPAITRVAVHADQVSLDPERRTQPIAVLGNWAAQLRAGLLEAATEVPGAALVPGLAIGDTSLLADELAAQMQAASLTHLTAVSGANCAMVIAAVMWAARLLAAPRRLRFILGAAALGGFVFLIGPDASVQRAAVMAAVVLVTRFGGKRAHALPALGLAMVVLLLGEPRQAMQAGFALSVAATAGILLLSPEIVRLLTLGCRPVARLPQWVFMPIGLATAAQLACAPLLLLLEPGIPVYGVLANVLAAPAVPWGTGLGLVALLLHPVHGPTAEVLVWLAAQCAGWIGSTATVVSQLPGARAPWPGGPAGALLLLMLELGILLIWVLATARLTHGSRRPSASRPWLRSIPRSRGTRVAMVLLTVSTLGIAAGPLLIVPTLERIGTPPDWVIVACDVGQGDALLVRDPERPAEVMLLDTGDEPEQLLACLDRFGVGSITLLVLSHDDHDHVGALAAVIDRVEAALIAPATREQTEHAEQGMQRDVIETLETAGVPTQIVVAGATGSVPDGGVGDGTERGHLSWEVLAPAASPAPADTNAASVVLLVQVAGVRILLLGDTGEQEHHGLVAQGTRLQADIVKVAHHGSGDQSAALYPSIGAPIGLVSVGSENRYGHPHPRLLGFLAEAGTAAWRTDLSGALAVTQTGTTGSRESERRPKLRVWTSAGVAAVPVSVAGSSLDPWQQHETPQQADRRVPRRPPQRFHSSSGTRLFRLPWCS